VHVAPVCIGSKEGSDHFGSYVRSLSLHYYKLKEAVSRTWTHDLMVTRQQLYRCARAIFPNNTKIKPTNTLLNQLQHQGLNKYISTLMQPWKELLYFSTVEWVRLWNITNFLYRQNSSKTFSLLSCLVEWFKMESLPSEIFVLCLEASYQFAHISER
jgi:hypothetical protein